MGALKPPTRSALVTALPLLAGAEEGAPILLAASGGAGRIQGEVDAFRGLLGPLRAPPSSGNDRREVAADRPAGELAEAGLREVPQPTGARKAGAALTLGFVDALGGEAALTRGFGVVFGGTGAAGGSLTFFDAAGVPLGIFYAPEGGRGGLSFLGVYFGASVVAQVRVAGAGAGAAGMAELIFGAPVPARPPAPAVDLHHLPRWSLAGSGNASPPVPHALAG